MMATITKSADRVKVTLYELGVTVTLEEGNKIQVKVSPASILQGRLCGLCGNNNYDISDDFRSLEGKLIGSRQFVMDNVMPSESCDAGDYESQLRYRHEGYCKTKKTVLIEKTVGDKEMTCFSKNPVIKCRSHCLPTSTDTRNVRFVCLPVDSSSAEQLVNKYDSGYTDLTEELVNFDANVEYEVDVPENCASEY